MVSLVTLKVSYFLMFLSLKREREIDDDTGQHLTFCMRIKVIPLKLKLLQININCFNLSQVSR